MIRRKVKFRRRRIHGIIKNRRYKQKKKNLVMRVSKQSAYVQKPGQGSMYMKFGRRSFHLGFSTKTVKSKFELIFANTSPGTAEEIVNELKNIIAAEKAAETEKAFSAEENKQPDKSQDAE